MTAYYRPDDLFVDVLAVHGGVATIIHPMVGRVFVNAADLQLA